MLAFLLLSSYNILKELGMQAAENATSATGKIFDSLAYAKRMESVGFTRQQAEALAEEQSRLIDERLATKNDMQLLANDVRQAEIRLEAKITETQAKLEVKIAETKADTIRWVVGMGFTQVAAVALAALLKTHS
jgi:hypothetical protein